MYRINDELYINLRYVSAIYKSKLNSRWRLVMVGASDGDEFEITEEEARLILRGREIYQAEEHK